MSLALTTMESSTRDGFRILTRQDSRHDRTTRIAPQSAPKAISERLKIGHMGNGLRSPARDNFAGRMAATLQSGIDRGRPARFRAIAKKMWVKLWNRAQD